MERITTLEKNGPSIAAEMREKAMAGPWVTPEERGNGVQAATQRPGYTVVSLAYDRTRSRVFRHRTLKASIRRACSMNAGKLRVGGEFALAIVTPDGHVWSIKEALELR